MTFHITGYRRRTATALVAALACFSGMPAYALGSENPRPKATSCTAERAPGRARSVAESCPGVRPGAVVVSGGEQCTLNFVFRSGDGSTYAGTAGHCTLEGPGETTFDEGEAPVATDASGRRIGAFAYAILRRPFDFALIRLDRGTSWDPEMCHFGGPTGVYSGRSEEPGVVHHFGNGQVVGREAVTGRSTAPARSAVARDFRDRLQVFAHGAAAPGDSGSPVITDDGRALGLLIGIGTGDLVILRLAPLLRRAERELGTRLRLATAPY